MIFGSNLVENDGWMAFLDLSFKVFPGEGTPGFVFGFQAFSFCGKASIVLNITLTFYSIVLNITLTFVSKRFQFNAAQYLTDKITWCQKKLTLAPKTFINFITRRSLMYHGRYSPRCFVHGANRVSVINWRRSGKQGWHKWPRPTTPLSAD